MLRARSTCGGCVAELCSVLCCVVLWDAGVLRFGSCDATLPFLPDHEIPKDFSRHIEDVSQGLFMR
jgi:hypothetical protein